MVKDSFRSPFRTLQAQQHVNNDSGAKLLHIANETSPSVGLSLQFIKHSYNILHCQNRCQIHVLLLSLKGIVIWCSPGHNYLHAEQRHGLVSTKFVPKKKNATPAASPRLDTIHAKLRNSRPYPSCNGLRPISRTWCLASEYALVQCVPSKP
jgi:hypothetical protein